MSELYRTGEQPLQNEVFDGEEEREEEPKAEASRPRRGRGGALPHPRREGLRFYQAGGR